MKLPPTSIAPVHQDDLVPLRSTPIACCIGGFEK